MGFGPGAAEVDFHHQRHAQGKDPLHLPPDRPGRLFNFLFHDLKDQFIVHLKNHLGFHIKFPPYIE